MPSTGNSSRHLGLLVVGLLGIFAAAPLAAEPLPRPEEIALPSEKPVLTDTLLKLLYAPEAGSASFMRTLDDALARLSQPTPLRGFVQLVRSGALIEAEKSTEAREAIEESIRLLPEYSGPLFVATSIYAYSDQPGRAADYLLRASRIDPEIVAASTEYEIDNVMRRLAFVDDYRRIRILSERLLEIGWKAESVGAQSSLVARTIESRMAQAEVAGAAAMVPKLLAPGNSRALLVQNRYRAIWPDIERWADQGLRRNGKLI